MVSLGSTYRAWLFVAALGLAAHSGALKAEVKSSQANLAPQAVASTQPSKKAVPAQAQPVEKAKQYKPECSRPRDTNEYSLCVSIEASKSANRQVILGWIQIIGLAITVALTGAGFLLARRALMNVERAWLHVIRHESKIEGDFLSIQPVWLNSGSTPAIKAILRSSWKAFPKPLTEPYEFPDLGASGETIEKFSDVAAAVIGPGGELFSSGILIPPALVKKMCDGELHIYVWGWVEYEDVLLGPRHRTEFAVKLDVVEHSVKGGEHSVSIRFTTHWQHNGADKTCMKRADRWPGNPR